VKGVGNECGFENERLRGEERCRPAKERRKRREMGEGTEQRATGVKGSRERAKSRKNTEKCAGSLRRRVENARPFHPLRPAPAADHDQSVICSIRQQIYLRTLLCPLRLEPKEASPRCRRAKQHSEGRKRTAGVQDLNFHRQSAVCAFELVSYGTCGAGDGGRAQSEEGARRGRGGLRRRPLRHRFFSPWSPHLATERRMACISAFGFLEPRCDWKRKVRRVATRPCAD
jgi:hypothetical protein